MKVKCIDNRGARAGIALVLGKIYDVKAITSHDYILASGWWMKDRFEVVAEETSVVKNPAHQRPIHDQNEPCPCGVGLKRSQCEYHKGT